MKVEMFKISMGNKLHYGFYECMSEEHAVLVCEQFKNRAGLIGRYYCETSTGFQFQV